MSTNVPALTIGPNGPVIPDELDILAGRQADIQAAFGGALTPSLTTPQGQIASSDSAIIGKTYGVIADLVAGMDPQTSGGRMQDGIAALYFLERDPAQATVVVLTCYGKTNTPIPINAKANDKSGVIYLCTQAGMIPDSGSIDLTFACIKTGPTSCPPLFIVAIFQAIPGWDSVKNVNAGVIGNLSESRADFEFRRAQSVALNANGQTGAVLALVLTLPGVLDAYAIENPLAVTSGASFVGSISGGVLTVTSMTAGEIEQGQMLLGATQGNAVTGQLSGIGFEGTYSVSIPETVASGPLSSQPAGVALLPNSIFVSAIGGAAADIGAAMLRKKNPGCNMTGTSSVVVADPNPAYSLAPKYRMKYQVPTPTAIKFAITLQNNSGVPSDALAQIQGAVLATFNGTDNTTNVDGTVNDDASPKARIAGSIFAARYYANIGRLGPWALIYQVLLGIDAPTLNSCLLRGDQIPTLVATDISVAFG